MCAQNKLRIHLVPELRESVMNSFMALNVEFNAHVQKSTFLARSAP